MIHPLIIRPEAEEDMAEGRDWYERHQQGLGTEFLTAIEEVFDRILIRLSYTPPNTSPSVELV
jgi:hypothetical protein